ncbi:hypothetical protein EJ110_NYTH12690 [Nymphaea thermarum]|nr:hypothetical protein EJ110_NYTH12690 [Nymphaea thermarum]
MASSKDRESSVCIAEPAEEAERDEASILWEVPLFKKPAPPITTIWFVKQRLFLTAGRAFKPPPLLRMVSDCEGGKFVF